MSIAIEKYHNQAEEVWDSFVTNSSNGTIFQSRRFLHYHRADKFKDYSWIFYKKSRIAGVLPAALIRRGRETWIVSHPGASYGGIVYDDTLGIRDAQDMTDLFLRKARHDGYQNIRITLSPYWYDTQPNQYIEFALLKAGLNHEKQELSSVVPVKDLPLDVSLAFTDSTRRAIRKSKRMEVRVAWSDDLESYYIILRKNLSLRHNVEPTHTIAELKKLHRLFPEKIRLLGAFYHGRMIGGIVNFICNPRTALAFYISHDMEYQHLRAVDSLLANYLQWGRDENFLYIDFGTFTLNMEPNWGLGKFKEKFAAKGAFRSTLVMRGL